MNRETNREEPEEIQEILPESIELIDGRRIVLSPSQPLPPERPPFRSRKRLALILFVATCLSTFWVGAIQFTPEHALGGMAMLLNGLSYAGPVMLILLAHEMGHYLQARRYRVPATLPYFIPMPVPPLGTMGAVIVQGAGYADRKALFDIAISGPLCGLVLALPVAYLGVSSSQVVQLPPWLGVELFGDPLILQWMIRWVHGPLAENQEIALNPVLLAGWVGILITALNLIPIGQLDGGHILYTLIGRKAHFVAIGLVVGAIAYMLWTSYPAYALLLVLLIVMGIRHPPTTDDSVRLGGRRIVLGWLTLSFIVVGFTPTPFFYRPPQPPPLRQQLPDDGLPDLSIRGDSDRTSVPCQTSTEGRDATASSPVSALFLEDKGGQVAHDTRQLPVDGALVACRTVSDGDLFRFGRFRLG